VLRLNYFLAHFAHKLLYFLPHHHVFRNVSISNRHLERALGKVESAIEAHLVLWTAAEQLAITQAFEKVSFMLILSSCFCFFSCEMATYFRPLLVLH